MTIKFSMLSSLKFLTVKFCRALKFNLKNFCPSKMPFVLLFIAQLIDQVTYHYSGPS